MKDIKSSWKQVVESATPAEEAKFIEQFAQTARDEKLIMLVTLIDADTGKQISINELDSVTVCPKVQLLIKLREDDLLLEWQPKEKDNIYQLLLE